MKRRWWWFEKIQDSLQKNLKNQSWKLFLKGLKREQESSKRVLSGWMSVMSWKILILKLNCFGDISRVKRSSLFESWKPFSNSSLEISSFKDQVHFCFEPTFVQLSKDFFFWESPDYLPANQEENFLVGSFYYRLLAWTSFSIWEKFLEILYWRNRSILRFNRPCRGHSGQAPAVWFVLKRAQEVRRDVDILWIFFGWELAAFWIFLSIIEKKF